jgi:hypothetical protein
MDLDKRFQSMLGKMISEEFNRTLVLREKVEESVSDSRLFQESDKVLELLLPQVTLENDRDKVERGALNVNAAILPSLTRWSLKSPAKIGRLASCMANKIPEALARFEVRPTSYFVMYWSRWTSVSSSCTRINYAIAYLQLEVLVSSNELVNDLNTDPHRIPIVRGDVKDRPSIPESRVRRQDSTRQNKASDNHELKQRVAVLFVVEVVNA